MMDCISVENMRISDQQTIATITPSLELMYRAAYGVFQAVSWFGKIAIVVGSGNNGGDGFALACILKTQGLPSSIYTLTSKQSADSSYYAEESQRAGVPVAPYAPGCLHGYDIVVDCIFGTGFQGVVRDPYRSAIEEINRCDAFIVSVDINSGMHGDMGLAPLAVKSDLTVTIGYVKKGLIRPEAGTFMKRLVCTDIGICLAYEEGKICDSLQWQTLCQQYDLDLNESMIMVGNTAYHRCPSWLDMNIIDSKEMP